MKFNLPKQFMILCSIQISLMFTFSILATTLLLYLSAKLHLPDSISTSIVATFFALNFIMHLFGGIILGRLLNQRELLLAGLICQFIGSILLSLNNFDLFVWGMAALVIGTGTSVTCINCIITNITTANEKQREYIFLLNYSATSLLYLTGTILCGLFQLYQAYNLLFRYSALFNALAIIIILMCWQHMKEKAPQQPFYTSIFSIVILSVTMVILHWFFTHSYYINSCTIYLSIGLLILLIYFSISQPTQEAKKNLLAYMILSGAALIFWTVYQLTPLALTFFIQRNVDLRMFAFRIPLQWIRAINPIIVIFVAPFLSKLFLMLRNKGLHVTVALQFSIALFLIGLSLLVLVLGIYFVNPLGYTPLFWVVLSFILQALGELFIVPTGYAIVGRLAPIHLRGVLMGMWLMLTGIASVLAWYCSSFTIAPNLSVNPVITNLYYMHTFFLLGSIAIISGGILLSIKPVFKLLMPDEVSRPVLEEI